MPYTPRMQFPGFRRLALALLALALILSGCQPATPAGPTPLPTATAIPTATPAPTARPDTLYIEPETALGSVSPLLLGSNYGPWIAVPAAMLPQAYASGVTIIRFPGGAWGDNNVLKEYEVDNFMAFCQKMGAQASFSVRLKNGTPETAAELVRYTNLEKGYGVKYWSVGNEPTLFGAELQRPYDTEEFNRQWRAIAEAMKAVDPSIVLIGPELHQFSANPQATPKDSQGKDWMIEFLKANGDLVDIVSIHRYPFPKSMVGPNATIEDLRQNTKEWDAMIIYLRQLIQQYSGRDLPIAVTEVNSHYSKAVGGEGTPDSFYNAIWWADVLGRLMKNGVFLTNHWLLTSGSGQGSWGLVGRSDVYPSYYVNQMYLKFGSQLVYSSSPDEDVSIHAALRSDGKLTILLINLADAEKTLPLAIAGVQMGEAELWLFDAEHRAENLGALSLAGGSLKLPGQSVSLLVLPYGK